MSLTEFSDTQFGNLKAVTTDVELHNNYFLATYRYKIDPETYSHNGFVLFVNNIENYNRMVDFCWDKECIGKTHGIYFSLGNTTEKLEIERFILGTTSVYASIPNKIIFGLKTKDMIDQNTPKHKNFDCGIFGNLLYEPSDHYFGICVNACQTGYYRDLELQRCIKCHKNCLSCIGPNVCSRCKTRHVLINGECIACQSPCVSCEISPHRCTSCFANPMFNASTFTCDGYCTSNKGCTKCDPNSGRCFSCTNDYELSDGECQPKNCGLKNCSICSTDESECRACSPGYVLNENECEICSKDCTDCPNGYQLSSGSCIAVHNFTFIINITRIGIIFLLLLKF